MVNPNKESKDEIVLVHKIIKIKHESEKEGEREIKNFDQVKDYTRMRRMRDSLKAQTLSEFKDGKEKLNEYLVVSHGRHYDHENLMR